MSDRPAAAVVFDDLITALTEIRDGYVLDEQRWTDPTEIAEAFRYVGQVLSASSELFWEGDPDHPRWRPSSRPPANCRATIRMRSTTSPGFAATVRTARSDPRAVLRLVHGARAGSGRRDGRPTPRRPKRSRLHHR